MRETFKSYQKALKRFKQILQEEESMINRDAAIKRFEFTAELAWKSVQKFLRNQSIVCRSPKECFKEAFKYGLIEDNQLWLEMLNDRNLTAHTYNEKVAEDLYGRLPRYLDILDYLENSLKKHME